MILRGQLTAAVSEVARIRGAFQLAVSEIVRLLSLVERATFAVFRTASVLWLLYFILIHHSRMGGAGDVVLSIFSGVVLLQHLAEIVKKVGRRRR